MKLLKNQRESAGEPVELGEAELSNDSLHLRLLERCFGAPCRVVRITVRVAELLAAGMTCISQVGSRKYYENLCVIFCKPKRNAS